MALSIDDIFAREHAFFTQFESMSLPWGGLTHDDASELWALIVNNHYKTNHNKMNMKIADVGCWTGFSTLLMAKIVEDCNGGEVVSIDWFAGSQGTNLDFAGKYMNIKKIYEDNLTQFPDYGKYIRKLDATTEAAASMFTDESFDVVFLDADHRYECVKRDINLWFPKVKKGGIMCGHDCEMLLPKGMDSVFEKFKDKDVIQVLHLGVCKALHEILPQARHAEAGSIWFVQK